MYHRQEKLKLSKRDLKNRMNITNLGPAVDYFNLENTKKKEYLYIAFVVNLKKIS